MGELFGNLQKNIYRNKISIEYIYIYNIIEMDKLYLQIHF